VEVANTSNFVQTQQNNLEALASETQSTLHERVRVLEERVRKAEERRPALIHIMGELN